MKSVSALIIIFLVISRAPLKPRPSCLLRRCSTWAAFLLKCGCVLSLHLYTYTAETTSKPVHKLKGFNLLHRCCIIATPTNTVHKLNHFIIIIIYYNIIIVALSQHPPIQYTSWASIIWVLPFNHCSRRRFWDVVLRILSEEAFQLVYCIGFWMGAVFNCLSVYWPPDTPRDHGKMHAPEM